MFIKSYVAYPLLIVSGIIGFVIGGNVNDENIVNQTLKMCNQKPHECRFKYDILMYNETGKVPYAPPKPQVQQKPEQNK